MSSGDELQTLKRGLEALAFLNTHGPANVTSIARRLDVPRANAHRIVITLTNEGYCRKIPNSHLYISNLQAKEILVNPCDHGVITGISMDVIDDLSCVVKWPLSLSTPQGATMVTRLATHLSTPLALSKIAPGHVAAIFDSPTGFTHMAFCSPEARQAILDEALAGHQAAEARVWQPNLTTLLSCVREDGFFILQKPGSEASLAVPVMVDGLSVAGIEMGYIKSATSRAHVLSTYLPGLQAAAAKIAGLLENNRRTRPAPQMARRPPAEPALSWTVPPQVRHDHMNDRLTA